MEVDPEVAALLDDLPATTLPDELVQQGWGKISMKRALGSGLAELKAPDTEQQPVYDHDCYQCGRPIVPGRGYVWTDHAGRSWCDAVLVEERIHHKHFPEGELATRQAEAKLHAQQFEDMQARMRIKQPPTPRVKVTGMCSAVKNKHQDHQCMCNHVGNHFGFHECTSCHHLWR